jgi:uncharacterized membrane protein YeaQ/YmgE (transglycosylase-associated protein family)
MYILWALIIGLVVGVAAAWLAPSRDPGGLGTTLLLATGGSVLAGFLDRMIGWHRQPLDGPSILASVLGAMFVLFVFRLVLRWRARTAG